ncbi:MAG TPA: hypothetical protein V6D17_02140 [Candidatus Obscuribacterales bacterium]
MLNPADKPDYTPPPERIAVSDTGRDTSKEGDALDAYRSFDFSDKFASPMTDAEHKAAMDAVIKHFGHCEICDGDKALSLDLDRDGTPDMKVSSETKVDLDGDGVLDTLSVKSMASALKANPNDVAALVALGSLAMKGQELTPEQKAAALAAADAVCAAANAALEAGDAGALAGYAGQLKDAFSGLNGAGKEGFFKKGYVENALGRVMMAMKDVKANIAQGGQGNTKEIVYSHRRS